MFHTNALNRKEADRHSLAIAQTAYEAAHGPIETIPATRSRTHYKSIHDEYAASWRAKEYADERFMATIRPMVDAGYGAAAIAAHFKIETARILYICKKHGIEVKA